MPISYPGALTHIGFQIIKQRPRTVLDVGCGSGMFGFVARQYTDLDGRRYTPAEWRTRVEGIEIFPNYLTPVHDYIYDRVYIGDAVDVLPNLGDYDMIICADVIEHMDRVKGDMLLQLMHSKSKTFYVVTPSYWIPQGTVFGNEHETHIYPWKAEDFTRFGRVLNLHRSLTLEGKGAIE